MNGAASPTPKQRIAAECARPGGGPGLIVREMAAKVVARHRVGGALDAVAPLRDDPIPRVRAAAHRAVVLLTAFTA